MKNDGFRDGVGASATATNVTASGVLFNNCTAHQFPFHVVTHDINRTLILNSFLVNLGASATTRNATASGVLLRMYYASTDFPRCLFIR
jgi:hypothetical protein